MRRIIFINVRLCPCGFKGTVNDFHHVPAPEPWTSKTFSALACPVCGAEVYYDDQDAPGKTWQDLEIVDYIRHSYDAGPDVTTRKGRKALGLSV